jgi:hypothetical protein
VPCDGVEYVRGGEGEFEDEVEVEGDGCVDRWIGTGSDTVTREPGVDSRLVVDEVFGLVEYVGV